ncbi:MAG: SRP-less Sec system protein [Leptospira sp.]|nr:SRP-less Sec system protein [Leptospira sp.]
MVLLLSSGSIIAQSGDGLDFLDKVENIQIPKETDEPKSGSTNTNTTKTKPSATKTTTSTTGVKPAPTQPAPKKTVTKTVPKTTVTKTTPPPTKTVPKQQPAPTTTTTLEPTTTRTAPTTEEIISPEKAKQIWIDAPLAMDPDYLPGFSSTKTELVDNKMEGENKKDSEPVKEFSRPLPHLDGNFSIWGSFVEFLSKYQKAFYIFGILLLFAIYRLKSGRNSSSSRKSTPTIRRMRR